MVYHIEEDLVCVSLVQGIPGGYVEVVETFNGVFDTFT